jgi:hypothetical protein
MHYAFFARSDFTEAARAESLMTKRYIKDVLPLAELNRYARKQTEAVGSARST